MKVAVVLIRKPVRPDGGSSDGGLAGFEEISERGEDG
jgi:hypothetical protein